MQTSAIVSALKTLAQERQITLLYAVESGSRAWGFAFEDSDWDVRFIYVHAPEWYLSIDEKVTIQ
jgi:predicted nucleotidyltransferase